MDLYSPDESKEVEKAIVFMVDRRHRELSEGDIKKISETYHNWRSTDGKYEDIKGFCKAAKIEEVEKNGFVLTPGRYVGTELVEEDDEVFEEKIKRFTAELNQQFEQSKELEKKINETKKTKSLCVYR